MGTLYQTFSPLTNLAAPIQDQNAVSDPLAAVAAIDALNVEHPVYQNNKELWSQLEILYTGGNMIRRASGYFLAKRPKELPEIYAARSQRMTYQNILGSAVDWYLANLFQSDPEIDYKQRAPDGSYTDYAPPPAIKAFYAAFRQNCNRRGTTFVDLFREVLKNLLLYQSSWVLIDFPHLDQPPQTRWEQEQAGQLMPYLINFAPTSVVDWCEDSYGNLEWVKLRVITEQRNFLQKSNRITRWYYYDRQEYRIYESIQEGNIPDARKNADLVDHGLHALAELNKVPIHRIQVPEGLWLANRVLPQVLDHLNTDNALSWALFLSALAMPVLIGDIRETPTLSEAGFIKLPKDSQISWTEPSGNSFSILENRINILREEIYRSMYLIAQGRSSAASPAIQSGYSKQIDMAPSGDVSNLFGDIIRAGMVSVLDDISSILGHSLNFYVRGFEFTNLPAAIELQDAMSFKTLGLPSVTAEKENYKKVLEARFPDINPSLMDAMKNEVDAAPTDEMKAQMQQEQMAKDYQQQFQQAAKQGNDNEDKSQGKAKDKAKNKDEQED